MSKYNPEYERQYRAKTKSERRHYKKQAKRLEHFLNKLFKDIDKRFLCWGNEVESDIEL